MYACAPETRGGLSQGGAQLIDAPEYRCSIDLEISRSCCDSTYIIVSTVNSHEAVKLHKWTMMVMKNKRRTQKKRTAKHSETKRVSPRAPLDPCRSVSPMRHQTLNKQAGKQPCRMFLAAKYWYQINDLRSLNLSVYLHRLTSEARVSWRQGQGSFTTFLSPY